MATTTPPLMAHQAEGVAFLMRQRGALLAFEQGLGKTLVAIEAFRRLNASGEVEAMLVLCPNSLKRNWVAELTRFAPGLSTAIVEGPAQARRAQLATSRANVLIMSYDTARAEIPAVRAVLLRRRSALVLDESHYIKSHRSLTSIAARHFTPHARYRWLLTGTPITNRPLDLYPQINAVTENSPLGSYEAFRNAYGGTAVTAEDLASLTQRIRPYVMRRTKAECLDLPPKTFADIQVELPAWQRHMYDSMRDNLVVEIDGMSDDAFAVYAPTALAQLLRLSQLASAPALLFPTETRVPGKQAELTLLLDELVAGGHKVILWSYYVGTIERLTQSFSHLGAVALYGAIPATERQAVARRFQEDPAVRVMIANPAAAGTGFTLTAATYTIYETLNWRYDHYAQSQDRNHRIGQSEPVTYVRLLAADTVELAIAEALERKARLAAGILGDADADADVAALSRNSFLALLRTGHWPA